MKKLFIKTLLGIILILPTRTVLACDVCGCAAGSNTLGMLTHIPNHFVGLRYQTKRFQSTHLTLFPGEVPLKTQEHFHSLELWGRYTPIPKLHLLAFVPYSTSIKRENGEHSNFSGLGDISLMVQYDVWQRSSLERNVQHKLQASLGIKLPTGNSRQVQESTGLIIPALQVGTGSFDFPLSLIYTVRQSRWGLWTEAGYRINMANSQRYKFGDRIQASVRTYYAAQPGKIQWVPQLGLSYEYAFKDWEEAGIREYSGSSVFSGGIGLDVFWSKFGIQSWMQVPLGQYIAKGQVKAYPQAQISFIYLF